MSSSTSIGRGPAHGGNENHDGDPRNTTFGETVKQEPPAGNQIDDEPTEEAPASVPAVFGRPETKPRKDTGRGKQPPKQTGHRSG